MKNLKLQLTLTEREISAIFDAISTAESAYRRDQQGYLREHAYRLEELSKKIEDHLMETYGPDWRGGMG